MVHIFQTLKNLVISHHCFARNDKNYKRFATSFYSHILLGDVLTDVLAMACCNWWDWGMALCQGRYTEGKFCFVIYLDLALLICLKVTFLLVLTKFTWDFFLNFEFSMEILRHCLIYFVFWYVSIHILLFLITFCTHKNGSVKLNEVRGNKRFNYSMNLPWFDRRFACCCRFPLQRQMWLAK